jgi:hypothetical protein
MKGSLWVFPAFPALLILAGCAPPPRFVNHARPDLSVSFAAFTDVGCPPDSNGAMLCPPESPLAAFDCDRIMEPDGLLGGLDPAYPIVYCLYESFRHSGEDYQRTSRIESEGYIYRYGGVAPTYVRFVVFIENEFVLLTTRADFAALYAPVESADEALGFALAHGDYFAYYGLAPERGLRYLTKTVEDTHVEESGDGYLVHLFAYQFFGCGPHTTSAVAVRVTHGGLVEEIRMDGIFENPEEDDLCVD